MEMASGTQAPLIEQTPYRQRALEAQRDLRAHVGQLFLHQLAGGEGAAEQAALGDILARLAWKANSAAPIAPQLMP
jgi:hypothetical protein